MAGAALVTPHAASILARHSLNPETLRSNRETILVDWLKVDRELAETDKPDARLLKVKLAMKQAEGDPAGDIRLVRLLVEMNDRTEAVAHGRRDHECHECWCQKR